ncbi:NADH-ubiquinone oxidoreductase chain 4 [Golovinomyces cichoracearum]|uniref:NADH-ubiquinone oxidoreductase chain 4 n=1 Tax=Golovinomyces cichoracearum TaxID=62708 RepID=A0A420HAA3_9PEZI|nr:NADH-ubiquinone oxidoreductase chain 4 [Golovinomyces cichoracearum]RKF58197.1 NADH-ubiquinone oxidoreductase chain 4 [Golovinomyces cichoracearum]
MSSIMGTTDFDALYKTNYNYSTELFLFYAHVESPLSGSIILAAIVLKLSLYGVITIIYASFSTLRTIDVKELIAYSSVSHAAVYLISVFSNTIQGIEGGIALGLAHGFVSSGLFICAGGVLYDRSGNCGVPLTLNFVGEFMSLYGVFERLPLLGVLASSSIVFSAAYTIYMFNRIAFAGSFSKFFEANISDLNIREFFILLTLVLFTIVLGIYPAPILDGLHYSVSSLIYNS